MGDCTPFHFFLSLPVLTELQQVDLITSKECKCLSDISDVVKAQWDKSPEVKAISADVLKRQGFEKESRLLAGRHSRQPSVHLDQW